MRSKPRTPAQVRNARAVNAGASWVRRGAAGAHRHVSGKLEGRIPSREPGLREQRSAVQGRDGLSRKSEIHAEDATGRMPGRVRRPDAAVDQGLRSHDGPHGRAREINLDEFLVNSPAKRTEALVTPREPSSDGWGPVVSIREQRGWDARLAGAPAEGGVAMKAFSVLLWLAWAAIGIRILLMPFWGLTVNQGMLLLLVAAPMIGVLGCLNRLFRQTPWALH
jgi:hypothetical protein